MESHQLSASAVKCTLRKSPGQLKLNTSFFFFAEALRTFPLLILRRVPFIKAVFACHSKSNRQSVILPARYGKIVDLFSSGTASDN